MAPQLENESTRLSTELSGLKKKRSQTRALRFGANHGSMSLQIATDKNLTSLQNLIIARKLRVFAYAGANGIYPKVAVPKLSYGSVAF
jgi:hypothetical protein